MTQTFLGVPLRFSGIVVGDTDPFSFDFGILGWTTPADPVVSATITTSSAALIVVGTPGISNNVVTVFLTGGVVNTEYLVSCMVTTQSGRVATRVAHLFVFPILPG
jgi:hypothetical protein